MIAEPPLAARATALASQALAAMPAAHGFVGVDLVLGADPDGADDAVIEINPRLTTSYVGLRAAVRPNLAETILQVCNGGDAELAATGRVEFTATGSVWRP